MKEDINRIKIIMSIKDLQDIKEFNRKEAQKEIIREILKDKQHENISDMYLHNKLVSLENNLK